ncbi:unnamed protein product [Rotaria sp. Silwood2]|nr:unnamed protein product [Rotaria sp. Silwood2]CAF2808219.1 unnamed protein product [Rotaria sp. Silwood2]CAF3865822.1 unnamed protein product [Rotaria sp. Silwood2]CAF4062990.1 unnamed protein product [Rotaria sp. Silwood2]
MSSSGHHSNSSRDTAQPSGSSSIGGAGTTDQSSSIGGLAGHGYGGSTDTGTLNKAGQGAMNTGNSLNNDIGGSSDQGGSSGSSHQCQ